MNLELRYILIDPNNNFNDFFLQQVQFGIVFVHTIQVQFYPTCGYPKSIAALLTLNAALFFYMFSSFYYNAYVLHPRQKAAQAAAQAALINGKLNGTTANKNGLSINGNYIEHSNHATTVDQSRKEQ